MADELGYAQITSPATATTEADVAGLSVTVTVGARPIVIRVGANYIKNDNGSGYAVVRIKESTTNLCARSAGGAANVLFPLEGSVRLTPSAGSHTYKISLQGLIGGTATIDGAATAPAYIQVVEV